MTRQHDCRFVLIYSQNQMVNNICLKCSTEEADNSSVLIQTWAVHGNAHQLCSQLDTDYSKDVSLEM